MDFIFENSPETDTVKDRCVVRLTTSYWKNNKGIYSTKSIILLKRKCIGYNLLEEEPSDAKELFSNIINLNECNDGIYEVITCNVSHDWETGYVDYYDYKLIPYGE